MNSIDTHAFSTIDSLALAGVVGGESDIFANGAGPNRFEANGQIKAQGYGVSAEGQGSVRTANTNYGACIAKAETPQAMKDCLDVLKVPQTQAGTP